MPTPSSDDRQTVWANQATPANESEWNGQADLRLLRVDALNPNVSTQVITEPTRQTWILLNFHPRLIVRDWIDSTCWPGENNLLINTYVC